MKVPFQISSLFVLFVVAIVISACKAENETKANYDLIIANVNLIDGTGKEMQRNVNVYVKDSKISKIDTVTIESGNQKNLVDGKGKYLIPGLIDGHTHPGPPEENFPKFIHFGVTGILVPGCGNCSDEHYAEMRKISEDTLVPSPKVYHTSQHFTMEGRHPVKTYPSPNWIDGKTVHYLNDTLQIASLVKQVSKQPIVGIKLTVEDGPLPPFVERMPQEFVNKVVKEAKKYDLDVYVHASDNEEMAMAEQAGVNIYLHYVMIDLDWEKDSSLIKGLVENNATIVTTLMLKKSWLYPLHPDWIHQLEKTNIFTKEEIEYLSNPARKGKSLAILKGRKFMTGQDTPPLLSMVTHQMDDLKALQKEGITIVLGTDTGNDFILPGISLHEEMQIMELGGFEPLEIIKMATLNAAQMLHVQDSLGSIEVGKLADMVLLDANPLESISNTLKINSVFKNGIVHSRIE